MNKLRLTTWILAASIASAVAPSAFATAPSPPLPALTADAANDASLMPTISGRVRGAAVLRAQILLDRARFSPGEIDAATGSNLLRAVSGFQASNGLNPTGIVDAGTWTALNRDTAPVLSTYVLTEADAAGPYLPIPGDMMEKSKLKALGFSSSIEAIGEKFHASPKLLLQLNPGKDFTRTGEQIIVPSVEPATPMPTVAKVVVDKSSSTVSLLDASDKVVAQYPASTGSSHDPLPIGAWKIQGVARNPVFNYNPGLFWDANPKHAKATIPAGPNNPVGVVWVDLSKEHYGIHGTPEPSKIGKTESHGCIRLTNWAALVMAEAVKPGMPAILQQ